MECYAVPQIELMIEEAIGEAFRGIKGVEFKAAGASALETGAVGALSEPDDMLIAEPPCHPSEPVKVPEERLGDLHCLICGSPYQV